MAARHPPRQEVIDSFNSRKESSGLDNTPAQFLSNLGLSIPLPKQQPYAPCAKALNTLRPMSIAQMKSGRHHRGRKITLRVCTRPKRRFLGISAVVEDESGTALPLSLFNMPITDTTHTPGNILPNATICIVKEPFLKTKKKEDMYSIRVDHVTDIVFLNATDSQVPDAWKRSGITSSEELRLQGNTHVKNKDWSSAIHLYSMAIHVAPTDTERQLALNNRAHANLRLGRYEAARSDAAQVVAEAMTPAVKGLFRFAMAHYGLRNFARCREALVQLLAASPDEPSAKLELARVDTRLHEQTTGDYSFASIYKQAKPSPGLVDVANFYGPVEVRESDGRGRGLFLTEAVSFGDLILCEKAVAYSRRSMPDEVTAAAPFIDIRVKATAADVDHHAKAELSAQLHQKLLHCSETYRRSIFDLFAGPGLGRVDTEPGAEPVIDAFLVDSIIEFNTIEIPTTLPAHGSQSIDVVQKRPPSDGVWLRTSYINHACYANCERTFFGDVTVVRAARDLPAGAELTVAYTETTAFDSLDKAQGKLHRWAFTCVCDLCYARRAACRRDDENNHSDPAVRARGQSILSEAALAFTLALGGNVGNIMPDYDRIDTMYPEYARPHSTPCPEIWALLVPRLSQLRLAASNGAGLGPMAVVDVLAAGFRAMSFDFVYSRDRFAILKWGMVGPGLPEMLQKLHVEYEHLNPHVCPKIQEYAKIAFRVLMGEDETFSKYFPRLVPA